MKINTEGLHDLVETALVEYQITRKKNLSCSMYDLSDYITEYIKKNYKNWKEFNKILGD